MRMLLIALRAAALQVASKKPGGVLPPVPTITVAPQISGSSAVGSTLSVTTGTWANSPLMYAFQWLRDGRVIAGATGITYTVKTVDQGDVLTCRVIAVNDGGASASSLSNAISIPASASAPLNSTAPLVSGGTTIGAKLTTTNGMWTNSPTAYTYQWLRDGSPILNATSATYTVLAEDSGKVLRSRVIASNASGSSAPALSSNTRGINMPVPVLITAPAISGTGAQGSTLTSTTGSWSNSPTTYSYQWLRDGSPITNAVNSTYLLVSADQGKSITCRVIASNSGGSSAASTSNTIAVAISLPQNTVLPVVSGSSTRGSMLSVTTGTWNNTPTAYAYQWLRDGATISGANSPTYFSVVADETKAISCRVTATNAGGSVSVTSNSITVSVAVPVNSVLPAISGTNTRGSTLSCSTGTWTNVTGITFTYQWLRAGAVISGEVSSTYTVVLADEGKQISCRVIASNAGGPSAPATSSGLLISVAVPVNTVVPVISGASAAVGQTLTVSTGTWTNSPTSYIYQWYRNNVAISGATSASYTVVSADQGLPLRARVTAVNAGGSSTSVQSSNGYTVPMDVPVNTTAPVISGNNTVGSTLTTTNGSWTNSPGAYAYQWLNNGTIIGGATGTTYVVASGDQGSAIRCRVTAINSGGNSSPALSNPITIAALPVNYSLPVINGTAQFGQTLTATEGTWTGAGNSYAYQWKRNGTAISGATTSSYTILAGDIGQTITCTVTATNAGGSASASAVSVTVTAITLQALSLSSTTATYGAVFTVSIIGKTSGSTITATSSDGTPLSVTGSTLTGTFSGVGSPTITLVETLANASNTPRSSPVTVNIAAPVSTAAGAYSAPEVTLSSSPLAYPPTIDGIALFVDHLPSYDLKVIVTSDYAGQTVIGNASIGIGTNTNAQLKAAVNSALAGMGINSGVGYIFLRVDNGTTLGTPAAPIQYGTAAVPTVISARDHENIESTKLAMTVTLSAPALNVWVTGQDQDQFELVGPRPGKDFILRYTNDKVQVYERKTSFAGFGNFDVGLIVEGLQGIEGPVEDLNVTLIDLDETPDLFSFADSIAQPRNTLIESPIITITGVSNGFEFTGSANGDEFRRERGGVWGDWRTAATTFTNNDRVQLRKQSSANYLTNQNVTFNIGTVSATWLVQTLEDPLAPGATYLGGGAFDPLYISGTNVVPCNLPAGRVYLITNIGGNAQLNSDGSPSSTPYSITVAGTNYTNAIFRQWWNNNTDVQNSHQAVWELNIPAGGVTSFTINANQYRQSGDWHAFTVQRAGAFTGGVGRPYGYNYGAPLQTPSLDVPALAVFFGDTDDAATKIIPGNGELIRGRINVVGSSTDVWGTKTVSGPVQLYTKDNTNTDRGGFGYLLALAFGAQ